MSKNVAMFVDVANMYYAARGQDVDVDYVALLKHATKGRDLIRAYAYTGLDPENENQSKFIDFLAKNGYKPVVKDIRKFGDGRMKANLDIELVVDLFRLADRMDIAVIVSGDGDFAPAIRALQDKGVRGEVISFKPNTSSDLMAVADEFMDIMKVASISRKEARDVGRATGMSAPEMPAKEVTPEFGFREASPSVAAAALAALKTGGGTDQWPPHPRRPEPARRRPIRAAARREPLPVATATDAAAESARRARRRRRRGGRGRGRSRREDDATPATAAGTEEIGWEEFDDLSAARRRSRPSASTPSRRPMRPRWPSSGIESPADAPPEARGRREAEAPRRARRRRPPMATREAEARARRSTAKPCDRCAGGSLRPTPRRSRSDARATTTKAAGDADPEGRRAHGARRPSGHEGRRADDDARIDVEPRSEGRRAAGHLGPLPLGAQAARRRRPAETTRAGPLGRLFASSGGPGLGGRLAIDGVERVVDRLGGLRRGLLAGVPAVAPASAAASWTVAVASSTAPRSPARQDLAAHRSSSRWKIGTQSSFAFVASSSAARPSSSRISLAALRRGQQRGDRAAGRPEQQPEEEGAPVPLLALPEAEAHGGVVDDARGRPGPRRRRRSIARVRRFHRSFSAGRTALRQVRSDHFAASAVARDRRFAASRRIGFESRHASSARADLLGTSQRSATSWPRLAISWVNFASARRSTSVDVLGDVVGRSCRSSRHVILLWVRPGLGARSMPLPVRNRPAGASAATGSRTYTPAVIETAAAGFLSIGQPAARRIACAPGVERGGPGGTLLVHGPRGCRQGAFVDDLLALSFCTDADARARPCNACRGCRDAGARSHPDLVDRVAGGMARGAIDGREHRGGRASLAARRGRGAGGRRAPGRADRACRPGQRADPERAPQGARGADRPPRLHPRRRRAVRLLPTIRSRCQPLRIGPVAPTSWSRYLMDVVRLPADQAEALASLATGWWDRRRATSSDSDLLDWRRRVQAELLSLLERGRADRFGAVRDLLDETLGSRPAHRPPGEADDEAARRRAVRAARGGDPARRGLAGADARPARRRGRPAGARAEQRAGAGDSSASPAGSASSR